MKKWIILVSVILGSFTQIQAEEDLYSFDVDNFTKKTWEWSGKLQIDAISRSYNQDSVFYTQKFGNEEPESDQDYAALLTIESRWDWEWSRLYLIGEYSNKVSTQDEADEEESKLREGYFELAVWKPHSISVGKKLLRWGKGYAYNPVAFLERPKNPDDPEAGREGVWNTELLLMIGKMPGFENSSLSIVYAPVRENLNDDIFVMDPDAEYDASRDDEDIWGVKWYGLTGTTDLDFYYVSYTQRKMTQWGADFSSNISSNFEVHGEYGNTDLDDGEDFQRSLLGFRYLTDNEITIIGEWFHKSDGYTADETEAMYASMPNQSAMQILTSSKDISQNYAYLQVSIKEPFSWLYFTPSVQWIRNMDDQSNNALLKFSYAPSGSFSWLASIQQLQGAENTQYGESLVQQKVDLQVIYSF
jgi:hypothetical protein